MSRNNFEVIILIGRPAAGKSEVIDFLRNTPDVERIERFHISREEAAQYWLELLVDSACVPETRMADLLDETRQLIAIFTTIDKRSKQ